MSRSKVVRPSRQTLAVLKAAVDEAREDTATTRRLDGWERNRLTQAQRRLLVALERYAAAIEAAGLALHWQLRDELRLLRDVVANDEPRPPPYRR